MAPAPRRYPDRLPHDLYLLEALPGRFFTSAGGVPAEIQAFLDLQFRSAGHTLQEAGFKLLCTEGVMPPNNRVTRCFGHRLSEIVPYPVSRFSGRFRARFGARFGRHLGVGQALDLGTGTGILALIAARHFERVIGVDLDPQAVACARYNTTLMASTTSNFVSEMHSSRWKGLTLI